MEALARLDAGLEAKQRALERDPFSTMVHLQISVSYWNRRRYDEAVEWASRGLEIDPRHPHAREHLAAAYLKKGDEARYAEENLNHVKLHGVPPEALEELRRVFGGGYRAMVRLALDRAAKQPNAFPVLQMAIFHGEVGRGTQPSSSSPGQSIPAIPGWYTLPLGRSGAACGTTRDLALRWHRWGCRPARLPLRLANVQEAEHNPSAESRAHRDRSDTLQDDSCR